MTQYKSKQRRAQADLPHHPLYDGMKWLAENIFIKRREVDAEKLRLPAKATSTYAGSLEAFPTMSQQVEAFVDSIDEFSRYIAKTDLNGLSSAARIYARQRPVAAFGIALVAGVAATRLQITKIETKTPPFESKCTTAGAKRPPAPQSAHTDNVFATHEACEPQE